MDIAVKQLHLTPESIKTHASIPHTISVPHSSLTCINLLHCWVWWSNERHILELSIEVRGGGGVLSWLCVCVQTKKQEKSRWEFLSKVEKTINPCNSPLHPAAKLAGIQPEAEKEKCVQEAYNPNSECYGCGVCALPLL
jgi:hypothetical protein